MSYALITRLLSQSPKSDFTGSPVYYCGAEPAFLACFIEEHPILGGDLLAQFCDNLEEALQAIDENYLAAISTGVEK